MISSLFSVTESTKNDRAMSAMARELRQLVDTANAPIFGIDVDVSSLAAVIFMGTSNATHKISLFTHHPVHAPTFLFQGDVNEWNDKTAEITGFTKEEAFDFPLVETFIVPSLRQSVQEVLDNALKGIETSNYELEFRTKTNEVRYLLVNATTRRDAENNIVGVVGVAQVYILLCLCCSAIVLLLVKISFRALSHPLSPTCHLLPLHRT